MQKISHFRWDGDCKGICRLFLWKSPKKIDNIILHKIMNSPAHIINYKGFSKRDAPLENILHISSNIVSRSDPLLKLLDLSQHAESISILHLNSTKVSRHFRHWDLRLVTCDLCLWLILENSDSLLIN